MPIDRHTPRGSRRLSPALSLLAGLALTGPLAAQPAAQPAARPAAQGAAQRAAPPAAAPAPGAGSYLATRIDQSALPLADRVTDLDGTVYLVEFERLVLSLRSGNKFRASVRFRRSLTTADTRAGARGAPIQSMTVSGTYLVEGAEIRFTPDSTGDTAGLRMLSGKVEGSRRISLPFDYRNGAVQRRRVLELHRRDDIL